MGKEGWRPCMTGSPFGKSLEEWKGQTSPQLGTPQTGSPVTPQPGGDRGSGQWPALAFRC